MGSFSDAGWVVSSVRKCIRGVSYLGEGEGGKCIRGVSYPVKIMDVRGFKGSLQSLNGVYSREAEAYQYQGETLPPFPLVLAFHLVLGKFHIYYSHCCVIRV